MDDALSRLAARHGVATEYWDQAGNHHDIAADTVIAVLAALGVAAGTPDDVSHGLAEAELADWRRTLPPVFVHRRSRTGRIWVHVPAGEPVTCHLVWEDGSGAIPAQQVEHLVAPLEVDGRPVGEAMFAIPSDLPLGYHQFQARTADGSVHVCPLVVVPDALPPPDRGWGLMVQLYAAASRQSWGVGDLGDLRTLAGATASGRGDFVLVNPMHAASPADPVEPSPYLPVTRRFANPIYLDLAPLVAAADLAAAQATQVAELHAAARSLGEAPTIDWGEAWRLKRAALQILWTSGAAAGDEGFAAFVHAGGVALQDFALWCVLAEQYGPRWQEWPEDLRNPRGPAVTAAFAEYEDEVLFHSWLQYLLDRQLAEVQRGARADGLAIGVIHDLAVGVHADGADTWRLGELLAADVSVGAPPDMYNQLGQNWAQPPWRPGALAEAAFTPYRDMLRAVLAHAGGVRVDHILGLYRQWWIPAGMAPAAGTYVSVDHEAMVGILLLEAARVGAVVIGEDLGTVADWIRDDMAGRGVLGTGVLWFEHDGGEPRPPQWWRPEALASVTVHDLPPTAGYVAGEHVRLRDELGLLSEGRAAAEQFHADELAAWRRFLVASGWLGSADAAVSDVVVALHRCLAAGPALLLGVSLPDLVGQTVAQNQPGTHREYPNWCIPLADATGRRVWVEDLADQPLWRPVTDAVRRPAGP